MKNPRTVLLIFTILFAVSSARPQDPQTPQVSEIVSRAAQSARKYRENFRNFLADEKKRFTQYEDLGRIIYLRDVDSTLLIYRLSPASETSAEFRQVRTVDGKPVPDAEDRNRKLLAELEKSATSAKVLQKLQAASQKYDRTVFIYGLTLLQAIILEEKIRPFFDFELMPPDEKNGSDVFVVKYRQREQSPYVRLNQKTPLPTEQFALSYEIDIPRDLANTGFELRGRFVIDAKTFAILGETRELALRPQDPLVLVRSEFEYRAAADGIVLPKTHTLEMFQPFKQKRGGVMMTRKEYRVDFTYDNFRRTQTDVRIVDDEP